MSGRPAPARRSTLQVTAERTGYVTRETISDAVKIGYGTIESSMPRIEGDPRVDQTLHVIKGEWSAAGRVPLPVDRRRRRPRRPQHRSRVQGPPRGSRSARDGRGDRPHGRVRAGRAEFRRDRARPPRLTVCGGWGHEAQPPMCRREPVRRGDPQARALRPEHRT